VCGEVALPPPEVGQHTLAVLEELGLATARDATVVDADETEQGLVDLWV
jgi:crotonobetainyl-CoA:carnitine CoA-transferase CaiB-like acyl-CoA transferase